MFEKTKTYCFGRYVVDVPVEAELYSTWHSYSVGEINPGFGVPKYREMIDATLKKLKNKEDRYEYVRSEYPEGGDKQIIISRVDLFGKMSYRIDAFTLNQRGIPGAGYFFYYSGTGYDENRLDEIITEYRNILNNIRHREISEIPTEPGFCFGGTFVANDGKVSQLEISEMTFHMKDNPDIVIKIASETLHAPFKRLLERDKAALDKLSPLARLKLNVIKEGKREINDIPGEESLSSFPSDDQTGTVHDFTWESYAELDENFKPLLQLSIVSGYDAHGRRGATASSLGTKQIQRLYESIVKTIRLRPVTENPSEGKAKPESSPPAPSQPGAQAPEASPQRVSTGQPCPKTGLWRCVEDGGVLTYHEGRPMPTAALYKPATGLLNRIKGVKSVFSHMGSGHWEWVGEDKPGAGGRKG